MKQHGIEICFHEGAGFCPLVIRPGWQVSQLSDRSDLHAETICQVERHDATDEVFVLVRGGATLVVAFERERQLEFSSLVMKQGLTYTIPCSTWHTIVTEPGMQVMIVEKDNTHVNDVTHRTLTDDEREALRMKLTGERCREVLA